MTETDSPDHAARIGRLELLFEVMRERIGLFETAVRADLLRINGKLDQLLLRDQRRAGSLEVLAQVWRAFGVPVIASMIGLGGYLLRPVVDRLLGL